LEIKEKQSSTPPSYLSWPLIAPFSSFFFSNLWWGSFPVVTAALLFDTSPTAAAAGYIYNTTYIFCFVSIPKCVIVVQLFVSFLLTQAIRPNSLKPFALKNKKGRTNEKHKTIK
jgi:hypothetical protein